MTMTIPQQRTETAPGFDYRDAYLRQHAEEMAVWTSTPAWDAGWAYGRQFGLDEAKRERITFEEAVEEVIFRILKAAGTRNLAHDLARSLSLLELNERRYAGASTQRLAELRLHAAGELRQVRQQHLEASRWAA